MKIPLSYKRQIAMRTVRHTPSVSPSLVDMLRHTDPDHMGRLLRGPWTAEDIAAELIKAYSLQTGHGHAGLPE